MNDTLKNVLIFVGGALAGSTVTWYLLKDRCEQVIHEEIESMREALLKLSDDEYYDEPVENETEKYSEMIDDLGYDTLPEEEEEEIMSEPYVISPDEYGSIDNYVLVELRYYADGVLVDDNGEIIDNVDELVGYNSLDTFGTYEDDSVHVRNDELMCDFEILADAARYSDLYGPLKTEE